MVLHKLYMFEAFAFNKQEVRYYAGNGEFKQIWICGFVFYIMFMPRVSIKCDGFGLLVLSYIRSE